MRWKPWAKRRSANEVMGMVPSRLSTVGDSQRYIVHTRMSILHCLRSAAPERQIQVGGAGQPVLVVPPLAPVVREAEALHRGLERQPVAQHRARGVVGVGAGAEGVEAAQPEALSVRGADEREVHRAAEVVAAAARGVGAHEGAAARALGPADEGAGSAGGAIGVEDEEAAGPAAQVALDPAQVA